MGDERLSNLSLMHIHSHLQVDLDIIIDDLFSGRNLHKLIQVKNNELFMMNKSSESNLYHTCILLCLLELKFRRV